MSCPHNYGTNMVKEPYAIICRMIKLHKNTIMTNERERERGAASNHLH